ncbi:DUF1254 domain-containing protein [Streptomyces sp. 1331.2]|uniref:DUF1254 domain-containing protein n=1 Tax=Streptomyces sp. 1331.2 TaxID=1938835 RepID=UPI000BC82EA2|nr:DUF1254 domain-containing protein [Streptomyces sp. 1331.2]SOB83417.1 Uncharacterized conserved protein [Streptomyces sp. 1331.2]
MVNPALVDPATVRATAAEAWIRAQPLLRTYRTLYAQALDDADPSYVGGFGVFRHHPQPPTPADTPAEASASDPGTPAADTDAGDTPYSRAWLDLRTEPWVVSVPAEDRYHVLPVHDLDTVCAGFIGSRTTGAEAGDHLVAGPDWQGEPPPGIRSVIRTATRLVGVLGRTRLTGNTAAAVAELAAVQEQYRLRPLHAHTGTPAPEPAPEPVWPVWREEVPDGIEFLAFLDFLLGFFPPDGPVPLPPAEHDLRGRLTDLGIDGRGEFEPAALPLEVRTEIARGIADGRALLDRATAELRDRNTLFGTRAQIGADFLRQAVGAALDLHGLPAEEVWYGRWEADSAGHRPPHAGDRDHVIRFAPDGLPPARFSWSVTLYALPGHRLVDNPLDRYSIGDHTPDLVRDPDGGLTLHVRHKRPANAEHSANWLPAPDGPFTVVLRLYGPDRSVLDGRWHLPPLDPR